VCRGQDIGCTIGAGGIDEYPRTDEAPTDHELYDTAALSPLIRIGEDVRDAGDLLKTLTSIDIVVIEGLSWLSKVCPPTSKAVEQATDAEGEFPPLRRIARWEVILNPHIFPREGT